MPREGRGPGETDILLKDIAAGMGITATYLSDIVNGCRKTKLDQLFDRLSNLMLEVVQIGKLRQKGLIDEAKQNFNSIPEQE